jgi:hypothetical protein
MARASVVGRSFRGGVALVAAAAFALGCSDARPSAITTEQPQATVAATAEASPECYGIDESVDTPPYTVDFVMTVTDLVVVADVVAIEGGTWNTSDGLPPRQKPGEHNVSNAPALTRGARYVFFLQPSKDADGNRHNELQGIVVAWPVDAGGNVMTEEDGTLTVAELRGEIEGS